MKPEEENNTNENVTNDNITEEENVSETKTEEAKLEEKNKVRELPYDEARKILNTHKGKGVVKYHGVDEKTNMVVKSAALFDRKGQLIDMFLFKEKRK